MSAYSDHSTVGGQVLAHRFRMRMQNWRLVGTVGKFAWLFSFLGYLLNKWNLNHIWNYLCCVKATQRENMTTLPVTLFNSSWMRDNFGNWREVADNFIATCPALIQFKAEFEESAIRGLKFSVAFGLFSVLVMVVANKRLGKSIAEDKELLSGRDYVDAKTLQKSIKDKSDISLAKIPYPKRSETRHTIITGTTGSGKTNVMIELIDQVKAKRERAIIVDTVGTFVDRYFCKDYGDVILNPLDSRSVPWSFLNECRDDVSGDIFLKNAAACLICRENTNDKFWEDAAQIVFVETAKKVLRERKSTDEFLNLLLKVSLEEIQFYLKGTYGYSLMDKRADKMAISIRATLINAVSVFDILKESKTENFSLRNWMSSDEKGTLFLSCKPAERTALIPLITAWLSMASESLLHRKPSENRIWFFVDELHNLKRLPKVETSLAEVRKYGGCFVMGTQMISQLNAIYGREVARSLTGLCGTKVVMNVPEPETAKYMSAFLGEKEEVFAAESISYGANTMRDGVNISRQNAKKFSVPHGEIMDLKTGEAFLKFSGIDLVAKTKFELHEEKRKGENALIRLFSKRGKEQKTEMESKIISLQDYAKSNSFDENDLLFYGLPLNDEILSRPIYFFDEDAARIAKFLAEARSKNKRVVVFEDGSKFYDSCFRKDIDVLLNPQKNGFAWNILAEFEGDYLRFVNFIIESSDIAPERRSVAEEYLLKTLSNLDRLVPNATTEKALDKLIFQPFKQAAVDLIETLGITDRDVLAQYSNVRDYLSLKFSFLKPIDDCNREISVREYANDGRFDGKILFVSCFNDRNAKKLLELILDAKIPSDILKIFSSKTLFRESKNCVIDGSQIGEFLDFDGAIIASVAEISKRERLGKIFREAMLESDDKISFFAKTRGNEKIVAINVH